MAKRFLLLISLFFALSIVFGATSSGEGTISCEFKPSCGPGEVLWFRAINYSVGSSSYVINSRVLLPSDPNYASYSSNYPMALCCKTSVGTLSVNFVSNSSSCGSGEDLLWVSNSVNGIISLMPTSLYSNKICILHSTELNGLDLRWSNVDYSSSGYKCLFRISNSTNGVVSDCNAVSSIGKKYGFAVWGKVLLNLPSIKCSAECYNKIDKRVYTACGASVPSCKNVPPICDGVRYGTWVTYNSTHEIKCAPPWNIFRSTLVTETKAVPVDTTGECENIIKKSYNVIYNNQPVSLTFYFCAD